jgi:hypothetical protein
MRAMDSGPADDAPAESEPVDDTSAPIAADSPPPERGDEAQGAADDHPSSGGWRTWGRDVAGPLAIAALVVGVIALLIGTAGLIEARRADTKKSHPATSSSSASSSAGLVTVPDVVGVPSVSAGTKLAAAKLHAKPVHQPSPTVVKGRVISQDPAAGTKVASGTLITLTVSDGPGPGTPPPPAPSSSS